jgi:hypothetical protein
MWMWMYGIVKVDEEVDERWMKDEKNVEDRTEDGRQMLVPTLSRRWLSLGR